MIGNPLWVVPVRGCDGYIILRLDGRGGCLEEEGAAHIVSQLHHCPQRPVTQHLSHRGTSLMRNRARYRGTSLIRNNPLMGPYSRPMPRALW